MSLESGKKSAAEMRAVQRDMISKAEAVQPTVAVMEPNWKAMIESQKAQVKTLGEIQEHLDTLTTESMYKRAALEYTDSGFSITLPFEAYRNAVKKIDISNPDMSKMEKVDFSDRRNLGLYVAKCVLDQPEIKSLPLELVRPRSFMITRLPDHSDFSEFPTIGPHGESADNINGRAVAIECFLDLCRTGVLPRVRWGSYNKGEQKYQGELESKDEYVRAFKSASLTSGEYNTTKLKYLVDWLISEWLHRIKR